MILPIIFYIGACYALMILGIHILLSVGVISNFVRDRGNAVERPKDALFAKISVVIPVRDEEQNLPQLFKALLSQSVQDYEVVFVNDRSVDRSFDMLENFRMKRGERVVVVNNAAAPIDINSKQNALALGVDAAQGEILLFTDSDCVLPPDWIESMVRYFSDPKVGLVFGQVFLRADRSFLQLYQRFDQLLINQWSSGTAGLGLASSCFGNNLAVRKTVVEEVGGFRRLGYTLVEDAALIAAVAKKTDWKIRVSTIYQTIVQPKPQLSWRSFIIQHVRWNNGAFYHPDFQARVEYRFVTLFLIASLLFIPVAVFYPPLFCLPLASFVSVSLMGLLAGIRYYKNKVIYFIRFFPFTLFFLFFYAFSVFMGILNLPLQWKGSELKSR